MMVYIGSDQPISVKPWNKASPELCVEELTDRDLPVRCQFGKPHVYRVGAHTGCGCGFQHSPFRKDRQEVEATTRSRQQFRERIEHLLDTQQSVEVYAGWVGGESEKPAVCRRVRPEDFPVAEGQFSEEGEFIVFTRTQSDTEGS